MVLWDDSKPGFVGDDNIYGIGIRVGYYTQAVSIWVANSYARHEAPYLHTLTIVFLLALFVGICQLCRDPVNTYAVEPFMLTSIADHTFYLGLWDPEPPYRFRWEVDFRKQFAVLAIWLAFTFFDTWYWWTGVWQMKPSNGPIGTVIFFPYVGNTPLFGPDEWISIAAKVVNAILILVLSTSLVGLCCNTIQQQRLDRLITAERLKSLTKRWLQAMGGRHENTHDTPSPAITNARGEVTEQGKRTDKDCSAITGITARVIGSTIRAESDDQGASPVTTQPDTDNPPPYHCPTRTATGLLKMGLWRRVSTKDFDLSVPPPDYVLYEPTFEHLNTAYDLLQATTTYSDNKKKEPFWATTFLRMWFFPIVWFADLFIYFCVQLMHPFRPAVLFAIKSHAATCRFSCTMSYPKILRLAIRHPLYREVKSKDVVLASRIILSTEPSKPPSRIWRFFLGWGMLGACSVLIIGTEMTIQWNKIQDVHNLTSVGQLIPFTLGVGSLLKIVWSALAHRGKKAEEFCYYNHCVNTGGKEVWQELGRRFLECRELAEKRQSTTVEEEKEAAGDDKC